MSRLLRDQVDMKNSIKLTGGTAIIRPACYEPRRLALWVIAIAFITSIFSPALAAQYTCRRVVDGDTIRVIGSGSEMTIRLVGIDAPETPKSKRQPGQPFSQIATRHLAGLVLNKPVEVKTFGSDRYGRLLAVVFVDDKNVNIEMLKAGLAEVYRGAPPSGQDMAPYWKAEKEAREAGRGMWVLNDKCVSPKEWRAKHKGTVNQD